MTKKLFVYICIALIVTVVCSIYLWCQNNILGTTKYEIKNSKIPSNFDGFKILQISDLHSTGSKFLINSIVNQTQAQKPNIIVITGDIVDRRTQRIDIALDLIKQIADIAPIYYVNGNHEATIDNYDNLILEIEKLGVAILDNKSVCINNNGATITMSGLKDPSFYEDVSWNQSIAESLNKIRVSDDKLSILLTHRPEYIDLYANAQFDLVLAGHAHGGQIRIPFVGGVISPGEGFWPKITEGIHTVGHTDMVVSRGIGNSGFPFRINNRPELVCVILKTK